MPVDIRSATYVMIEFDLSYLSWGISPTCIVDEYIQLAKLALNMLSDRLNGFFISDIELNCRDGSLSRVTGFRFDLFQSLLSLFY